MAYRRLCNRFQKRDRPLTPPDSWSLPIAFETLRNRFQKRDRPSEERAPGRDQSGVALFMVIGAISVLSLMVTEFTYIAQMNQKLAFDALDSVKAHYLAKSGFKLSLLRLKAYMTVRDTFGGGGGNSSNSGGGNKSSGGGSGLTIPKAVLDKIWSFPFIYPIPTTIPGLTPGDKEQIEKFQKSTSLEGSFSSIIQSESGRYNLNMVLPQFAPPAPSPSPTSSGTGSNPNTAANPSGSNPSGQASPSPQPSYNAQEAQRSLNEYLTGLLTAKAEADPDFGSEYRDFKIEDLVDQILSWADPTHEPKTPWPRELIQRKRAPFYSLSELRMLPMMDDDLYDVFAPGLTAQRTTGINLNSMTAPVLKALVPQMTTDEVTEFFKWRDSTEEDNSFKKNDASEFFDYLKNSVAAFKGNDAEIQKLREDLSKKNIRLLIDETEFKIVVQATVNSSIRRIEAWVSLANAGKSTPSSSSSSSSGNNQANNSSNQSNSDGSSNQTPQADPGIKITFMRVL